jgi:hypothetical protein
MELLLWIEIDQIKAKLGQVPVLISADLVCTGMYSAATDAGNMRTHRMISSWDKGDSSSWQRDKSAGLDWYLDKRHVVRGQDVEENWMHLSAYSHVYQTYDILRFELAQLVARALRDNTPIYGMLSCEYVAGQTPNERTGITWNDVTVKSRRPYIEFAYLYPIEFYKDDGAGDIDLSSAVGDNPGEEYYLGAVEPGQTGTPVKGHIRNYSQATQQVELFDDHPEYTDPITRIGTGQLDFIELAEAAVSQKYTPTFYSSTQYEVKAVAHRDNAVSLHPTINADASWRGDVTSDFTAPSGGFTIPATAWQADGILTADEIEIAVTGNTTDTSWPADSNDQVEITKDNAGSADATAWRPIQGHREKTTAQTTIDATTKLIPTRMVVPADWPVNTKAFIADQTNINEGAISSVQEMDIGADSFVGSGLDDITISGNFNGSWTNTLRIRIDGTGTPDTFEWSIDNGSTWEETDINCSTSPILLQDGIYVQWAADTGHTLTDYWNSAVKAWAVELKGLTANSNVYGVNSIVGTTLPIRDMTATTFTTVSAASGVSEGTPARLWVESTVGLSIGADVFIQSPESPDTAETREIDSIGSGFIDLTVALTQDYTPGNFVTKIGSGEAAFWMRPVATAVTVEELKRLRINARML